MAAVHFQQYLTQSIKYKESHIFWNCSIRFYERTLTQECDKVILTYIPYAWKITVRSAIHLSCLILLYPIFLNIFIVIQVVKCKTNVNLI